MKKKERRFISRKRSRQIFIVLTLAWPVFHFLLMWGINFSMIPMAFKSYENSVYGEFVGWDNLFTNFIGVFNLYNGEFRLNNEWYALRNTLSLFVLVLLINIPAALCYAYLVYAKVKGWKMWQTLLYLPNITSAIVLVLVFRGFILGGPLNTILNKLDLEHLIPYEGWLGPKYAWPMILIFSVWTGISNNLVFYLAAMRRIPDEFLEAARLDGATEYQMFFKIVFPLVFPSLVTLIQLELAGLIGWAMPSFLMMDSMEGYNYTGAIGLSLLNWSNSRNFGIASAYGLLVTVVIGPIMMIMRKMVNKVTEDVQF